MDHKEAFETLKKWTMQRESFWLSSADESAKTGEPDEDYCRGNARCYHHVLQDTRILEKAIEAHNKAMRVLEQHEPENMES